MLKKPARRPFFDSAFCKLLHLSPDFQVQRKTVKKNYIFKFRKPVSSHPRPKDLKPHWIPFSSHRSCRPQNALFILYFKVYGLLRVDLLLSSKYIYSVEF
jgi:hypothetical protein